MLPVVRALLALLALLAGLAGCRRAADRATSLVTLSNRGVSTTLTYGKAVPVYEGLQIRLGEQPIGCKDKPGHSDLAFSVYPGPGGRFFAGSPVGAVLELHGGRPPVDDLRGSAVTLEPFVNAAGQRVRGSIAVAARAVGGSLALSGGGSFDVEICERAPLGPGDSPPVSLWQPEHVSGAVKGTFSDAGTPFEAGSAFVLVKRDMFSGEPYVSEVDFLSGPATCPSAGGDSDQSYPRLIVFEIRAGNKASLASPKPAPMYVEATGPGTDHGRAEIRGRYRDYGGATGGWIQLDDAALEAGVRVKGAVYADLGPGGPRPEGLGKIAGAFEATVCRMIPP